VREQNQREFFGAWEDGRVQSGFSGFCEWIIEGANPLHLFAGGGIGGIPDVGDEGVRFCAAPFVRLGRSELAVQ